MKFYKKTKIAIFIILFNSICFSQASVYQENIDFYQTDQATLVGQDGLIMKTTDGGLTWNEQFSGTTNVLYGNEFVDNLLGIAVGENGLILKTTNGGENWIMKSSNTLEHLKDVCYVDQPIIHSIFVACGENGKLLRTTDSGDTWVSINSNTQNNLNDVFFWGQDKGYVVGEYGTMLKTTDGGVTWSTVDLGTNSINLKSIAMATDLFGTAVGYNSIIINTFDGGISWIVNNGMLVGDFNDIKFFGNSQGLLVGNDGIMARTTDNGCSWDAIYSTVITDIMSVAFENLTDGITAGEDCQNLYTYDGGLTWSTSPVIDTWLEIQPEPSDLDLYVPQNYPNPFNPATLIGYEIPFDAFVTVKIYDITGREIANLINAQHKSGYYQVKFDAGSLSSGVYFYRVTAAANSKEYVKTMKMILKK